MKRYVRSIILLSLLWGPLLITAGSKDNELGNGITIGKVKLYNDVTLRAKIRQLAGQLSTILGLDSQKVREGLFSLQGSSSVRTQFGFQAQSNPTASIEQSLTKKLLDQSGAEIGSLTENTKTPERKAGIPVASIAPAAAPSLAAPQMNAADRISEYTELYYQVINLQTILQRAASDIVDLSGHGDRIPVVLGFPISITTPTEFKNSIAEVNVEVMDVEEDAGLKAPIPGTADVQVIALMPQEKTYNVSRLTSKITGASFGVVTPLFNLGLSGSSAKDTIYLAKDFDTIALNFEKGDLSGPARFGWHFRPVFENKAVNPGYRQVLVALSLPPKIKHILKLAIRTRWYRYNRSSMTVGLPYLNRDASFTQDMEIKIENLIPKINKTEFISIGNGKVRVDLTGDTFFDDMDLLVGNRKMGYDEYLKVDNQHLSITLTNQELVDCQVKAVNMFGQAQPLVHDLDNWSADRSSHSREEGNFHALKAKAWERPDDKFQVDISLEGNWADILSRNAVIQLGDTIFGLDPAKRPEFKFSGEHTYCRIPDVAVNSFIDNPLVKLNVPFNIFHKPDEGGGFGSESPVQAACQAELNLGFDVISAKKTGEVGNDNKTFIYTVLGRGLNNIKVSMPSSVNKSVTSNNAMIGLKIFSETSSNEHLKLIEIPESELKKTKSFIFSKTITGSDGKPFEFGRVITLDAPEKPAEVKISSIDPVKMGFSGPTRIRGQALERIKHVRIGDAICILIGPQKTLKDEKSEAVWYINLIAEATKTSGKRPLIFVLDDNSMIVFEEFQILDKTEKSL